VIPLASSMRILFTTWLAPWFILSVSGPHVLPDPRSDGPAFSLALAVKNSLAIDLSQIEKQAFRRGSAVLPPGPLFFPS